MKAFNVRLNGKLVDTVFYTPSKGETVKEAEENTRRSLIDHDGYDAGITVRQERNRQKGLQKALTEYNLSFDEGAEGEHAASELGESDDDD